MAQLTANTPLRIKGRLTPFRKRVWDVLCEFSRRTDSVPSSRYIADELNANETRVSNALVWLELNGYTT